MTERIISIDISHLVREALAQAADIDEPEE
jgi:hypothetical protein